MFAKLKEALHAIDGSFVEEFHNIEKKIVEKFDELEGRIKVLEEKEKG